ncbi:MFS transporter [Nesterenkonia sp. NBAIMH1]|uniref:MFS transporter n=1 Tax=Nesterenkonia sp. NBAIMH1 TaxID=2600320 RepID=UPI0011B5F38B|nr:MFS transporter [Nesterenkonia sp. NBAIMH1]
MTVAEQSPAAPHVLTRRQASQFAGAGLALIAVSYGVARFAYGLFVPAFRTEFGLDPTQVGLIGSLSYGIYCIAIYPAMMLTPRFGSRRLTVLAGALATIGMALVALAPSAAVLTLGVALGGLSTGIVSPPLAHAVALRVPRVRRDRTQAIVNSGTGLGVALSAPVALLTLEHWRSAWLAFSLAALIVTLWAAFSVPRTREAKTYTVAVRWHGGRRRLVKDMLPDPLLPEGATKLLVTSWMLGMGTAAVWVFGRDVLIDTGGQGEISSTLAWAALGACGLLGAGAGDLAFRLGLTRAWAVSCLCIAATTALIGSAPQMVALSVAASGLFGAAYIATTGLLLITAASTYHQQPASGVGLSFLTLALGQAIGGALLGSLIDSAGAALAFAGAAALTGLSAALAPSKAISTRTQEIAVLRQGDVGAQNAQE